MSNITNVYRVPWTLKMHFSPTKVIGITTTTFSNILLFAECQNRRTPQCKYVNITFSLCDIVLN